MITAPARPQITPTDRLGLTLCIAIIVHGIVILGVTFSPEDVLQPKYETMEIILVQQQSDPVKDAQFLAQANLEGGGDTPERVSPATPMPAPFPEQKPEITSPPAPQPRAPAEAAPVQHKTTENEVTPEPVKNEKKLAAIREKAKSAMTEEEEETRKNQAAAEKVPEHPDTKQSDARETVPEQAEPMPDATELLANSLKIASLSAELDRKLEARSQRPRRKFISASTKEYKYAAYMEAWRAKVERVGNLNYPDDARKNNISGSLILDVALNNDGSVNQITVRRSSGSRVLDDAAIHIVELSSPFAPFPDQIRQETDILHITRTWQFLNNISFK